MSVVISGLFSEVFSLLNKDENPPFPHTMNLSLGIHGNLDRLPTKEILEISTMCGHGLVSHSLVEDRAKKLKEGKLGSNEAASDLAKHCVCGVFNKGRAKTLLEKLVKSI